MAFGSAAKASEEKTRTLENHKGVAPKLYSSRTSHIGTTKSFLPATPELRIVMNEATATQTKVLNYIDGSWVESKSTEWRDVINPATRENTGETRLTKSDAGGAGG